MEGIVFDIQRFSTNDGPGIRTTVFLKGCMMKCKWCHNPESLSTKVQLAYENFKCVGCGKCEEICQKKVHGFVGAEHKINYDLCDNCGKCVDICENEALKFYGRKMSVEQVINEVLKDKKYYGNTGGVTFSGGEPTMQGDFLLNLLKTSKENGISTAIETNGIIKSEYLKKIMEYTDVFLLDYKASPKKHENLTGLKSHMVLDTLKILEEYKKTVFLRCPIIQGINDDMEHFENIKKIKNSNSSIIEAEIMPYHSIGKEKWESVGYVYEYMDLESATKDMKEYWQSLIK